MPAAKILHPPHLTRSKNTQRLLPDCKSTEADNKYILPLHLRHASLGLGITLLLLGAISLFIGGLVYVFTIKEKSILSDKGAIIWMGIFVSSI